MEQSKQKFSASENSFSNLCARFICCSQLDSAYRQLLSHVLAVRDQPPEVVKTKTKLKLKSEGLTVKLLGKAKFWTANKPLKVGVTVVNEEEAKLLYNTGELTTDMKKNGSKIKNNVGLSKSDGTYSFT